MKIKGAIFDMDGVIVDNHKYHFAAWMEFSRKHHFELNADIYREKFNGKTNADLFRMIFGDPSKDQIDSFAAEKEGLYQQLYREHIKPVDGLVDFLKDLQRAGIKTAVGTSAPPHNVDFTLINLNLSQYFEVVVDGTHVEKGKPDPQVYLLCCQKLGLKPADCVVFEDSMAGLDSGRAAGCEIVGVATSHSHSELAAKTRHIIRDFTQVRDLIQL